MKLRSTLAALLLLPSVIHAAGTQTVVNIENPQARAGAASQAKFADFDALAEAYKALRSAPTEYSFSPVVTFDTILGTIEFAAGDLTVNGISDAAPAFVRIGKRRSTESRELIFAWLTESAAMKLEQGYAEVAREEFETPYGRGGFTLLRRGDHYFTTYVQCDRTHDERGGTYLAYTYHVEFGLWSRATAFRRQQAAVRFGN